MTFLARLKALFRPAPVAAPEPVVTVSGPEEFSPVITMPVWPKPDPAPKRKRKKHERITDKEMRIVRSLIRNGATITAASRAVGRSHQAIRYRLNTH